MPRKHKPVLAIVVCCTLSSIVLGSAFGDDDRSIGEWEAPGWASNLDSFEAAVRVNNREGLRGGYVEYHYPNDKAGEVVLKADANDEGLFHFSIPPEPEAGLGDLRYTVRLIYDLDKEEKKTAIRMRTSKPRSVPMAYAEELDITGEAGVPLLYPLPNEAYQVRYTPCCNIYGGLTDALRVPVNPTGAVKGLPEKLLSDFVVLEPDGLSASTSGLYFDFTYDGEKRKALGGAAVALYEWNGNDAWSETLSYDVDEKSRKVSFHCPDGGAYVLGAKQ